MHHLHFPNAVAKARPCLSVFEDRPYLQDQEHERVEAGIGEIDVVEADTPDVRSKDVVSAH